jgi:hypothetical protein
MSEAVLEVDTAIRAAVDRDTRGCCGGMWARVCTRCPVVGITRPTVVAYCAVSAWLGFCLYYVALFGLYQPQDTMLSLVGAWVQGTAQAMIITQPLVALVMLVWSYVVWPAWLPYLMWIPRVGPLIAGKAATASATASGSQSLTGRLENLTLVRAAGYASALPPEAAVIAYGATAGISVVADRALTLASRSAHRLRRQRERGDAQDGDTALSALTEAERHELIVRRYLLTQLKSAEGARRQVEAARREALAFSLGKRRASPAPPSRL